MVDRDYNYVVLPQELDPFGPAGKENLDVIRCKYDFSQYLEPDEVLQVVQFPTVVVAPEGVTQDNWRQDFPLECCPTAGTTEADLYPLRVVSEAITNLGKTVELRLNSGTPGFTYVVSFVVIASDTRRRKQVDTLVRVETALNPQMVSPGDLDPDIEPPIIVDASTALPLGFNGLVILQNSGNRAGIVITLPPSPELGQMIEFIDSLGKDEAYPVTFRGDGDVPIDGDGRTVFVSSINFDVLRWKWVGTNWHLMMFRFGWIA